MAKIENVIGRRVWDSQGCPAVEAEIHVSGGVTARAIAPMPDDHPIAAAQPVFDGGAAFGGHGVMRAVAAISGELSGAITGIDVCDQDAIDRRMIARDGMPLKSRLGVNAILAVSLAAAKAAANVMDVALWEQIARGKPPGTFPTPQVDLISAESAAAGHQGVDFLSLRVSAQDAPDLATALDWAAEVSRAAAGMLQGADADLGLSATGGRRVRFETADEALSLAVRAIERAGLQPGEDMGLVLEVGANRFGRGGRYLIAREAVALTTSGMIERSLGILRRYPISMLIDPLAEDDLGGVVHLTELAGQGIRIAGAGVLISNPVRIAAAAKIGAFNAVEIRLSDCGTLTEAREAIDAARSAGFGVTFRAEDRLAGGGDLAHIALGLGASSLAAGGVAGGERIAIWNEALRLSMAPGA